MNVKEEQEFWYQIYTKLQTLNNNIEAFLSKN